MNVEEIDLHCSNEVFQLGAISIKIIESAKDLTAEPELNESKRFHNIIESDITYEKIEVTADFIFDII